MDIVPATSKLPAAVPAPAITRDPKTWAAAQDFEAVYLTQLTGLMFDSAPVNESFGGGSAENAWRGMMANQMGKQMARAGGVGLAPSVYDQMIRLQAAK